MAKIRQTGDAQLLLADDHLVIDSPYDPAQVAETKRIPGARWDRDARVWRIPMASLPEARDFAARWGLWIDPAVLTFTLPDQVNRPVGTGRIRIVGSELDISFPYDSLKSESVKRLPDTRWEPNTQSFRAPLRFIREVVDWGTTFQCRIDRAVHEALDSSTHAAQSRIDASRAEDAEINVPGLAGELRPFQRAGVAYALEARRCFIADDMGLGKTLMSLASVEAADEYPLVVVCPSTLTHNWRAEANRWLPHRSVVVLEGMPKPDLVDEIKRSLALDPHVGGNGLQKRQDLLPRTEVPPVDGHLLTVPLPRVGVGVVDLAPEGGLDPLQDGSVGVGDVDPPVPGESGERAFSVDERSKVRAVDGIDGSREVSGGPSLPLEGDVDGSPLAGVVNRCRCQADGGCDLGNTEPFCSHLLASRFDLGRDLPLLRHADLFILGYPTLHAWEEVLMAVRPNAMVLDESHMCKTPTAKRTKAAIRVASVIPGEGLVLCLTGTPVTNRPAEYVSQLEILGHLKEFGGKWAFYKRYANAFRDRHGHWHLEGASHLDELNDRLRASCYIRRTKDQVMSELPPVQHNPVLIKGTTAEMKEYAKAERDIVEYMVARAKEIAIELGGEPRKAAILAKFRAESNQHLVQMSQLRKLAARAKMAALHEWAESQIESGNKVVLAAHHREIVDELAAKYGGLKIQGGQPIAEIEEMKVRFQNEHVSGAPAIVLSIQAAKTGHTLTAAQNICFVELPWTPADLDQTTARLHRIGQQGSVEATYLLCEGTVDEQVYDLLGRKRKIVEMAIDGRVTSEEEGGDVGDLVELFARAALESRSLR